MKSLSNLWFLIGFAPLFGSLWQTLALPQNRKDLIDIVMDHIQKADQKTMPAVISSEENEPPTSHRQPPAKNRLKRQISNDDNQDSDEYYDENSDEIISELENSDGKHFGQNLQKALTKLSESMKYMWNNLTETMKQFAQNIHNAFNDDSPTSDYDIKEMKTEENDEE